MLKEHSTVADVFSISHKFHTL